MIKCPGCGRPMSYKAGTNDIGRKYEFYGCTGYPTCREIVQMDEANKHDDGKSSKRPERSIEEEAEDLEEILLRDGYDRETASYARHMWEKD